MLSYKPKENLKKFLASVITLGLFVTFLVVNVFSNMYGGFSFRGLNIFLIGAGVAALLFLVNDEKIHKIALAMFAVCLAFLGLTQDYIFLTDIGYGEFFSAGETVVIGIGVLFHDLYILLLLGLLVFATLSIFLKWKFASKILFIGTLAVVGTFLVSFLFEFIGAIVLSASSHSHGYYGVSFGEAMSGVNALYPFLPLSMLAFFFFNADEIGFKFEMPKKKEEPKKAEEKEVTAEKVEEPKTEPVEAEVVEAEAVEEAPAEEAKAE